MKMTGVIAILEAKVCRKMETIGKEWLLVISLREDHETYQSDARRPLTGAMPLLERAGESVLSFPAEGLEKVWRSGVAVAKVSVKRQKLVKLRREQRQVEDCGKHLPILSVGAIKA